MDIDIVEMFDKKIKEELDNLRYYKRLNKKGEVCEVIECSKEYVLDKGQEWATKQEYRDFVMGVNVKKLKQSIGQAEQKIFGVLKIDNYLDNARIFYNKHPFFFDNQELWWIWKGDRWEMTDEVEMARCLDQELGFMGQSVSATIRNNHLTALKWVGRENKPKEAPKKWIQFKDKAYSIKSNKVYEVKPNYFFTNPIPWELSETDETPTIDKLITDWVGEKYKQTAYEIIAYCCLSDYPIHLVFCFVGCGRNGKSKFLGLISKFLGKDNICSTELDSLLTNRFESAKLYKKLLCQMGETNFGIISKTSLLKKLTGQDLIGFEFKNKKPFDDYNYAKLIISSNSLPTSSDTSEGFYRRWLILDFSNTFEEGKDILETIPEIEYRNLALKVTKILPDLIQKGRFTEQGTIEERQEKYIAASNPLSLFIKQYCEKGFDKFMRYSELYTHYIQFLNKNKKRKISYKEFNDVLTIEGLEVVKTSKKINDEFIAGKFIEGICFIQIMPVMLVMPDFSLAKNTTCKRVEKPGITGITSIIEEKPIEIEELITPYIGHCKVCGANPCYFYGLSHYFCSKDCFAGFEAQKHV